MNKIELKHVKTIYDKISSEFDRTRHYHWKGVINFINSLESNSIILDAGCGNGKNMQIRNDLKYIGCDISDSLLNICKTKGLNVVNANIKSLSFQSDFFDHITCVAVLHHVNSYVNRFDSVKELIRVLKPKGKLFLQVWAREQKLTSKFIDLYYSSDLDRDKDKELDKELDKDLEIEKNDFFVTWQNKTGHIFKRYYHLFTEDEVNKLILNLSGVKLIDKFFEHNNWCIILEKK